MPTPTTVVAKRKSGRRVLSAPTVVNSFSVEAGSSGRAAVALVDDLTGREIGDGDAGALPAEAVRRERLGDAPGERGILRRLVCRRARDRDADRQQAEREHEGAQSPHHRNVMVMVWVPYTDARSLGIQMSIVAPITDEPVSAATHGP